MIAEAKSVCILWAMGVTQHSNGLRHLHRDFQSAAGHRQLHAARAPAPTRCAATTTSRAPATTARCPNLVSGYQSVDDPEVRARFRSGWGVDLPATKGLDNHEMVDAIHAGKLQGRCICSARK